MAQKAARPPRLRYYPELKGEGSVASKRRKKTHRKLKRGNVKFALRADNSLRPRGVW